MNPFDVIYGWFVSLFGNNLDSFLLGGECDGLEVVETGSDLYTGIGLVALAIAVVIMVVYYYVINSSKLNKWWHWVIVLLFIGVINLFIGYGWTSGELANIGDCLMYLDGDNATASLITESDCWMFGLANFFVSGIFFIIATFVGKWWSTSLRRTPF
ncbi:MAG: hypothetical protein LBN27_13450 [Prevotellaceae bacterium]|jgi:hypothetical protein|nr:hypothetical protein [Prevotellaceae bacterium]